MLNIRPNDINEFAYIMYYSKIYAFYAMNIVEFKVHTFRMQRLLHFSNSPSSHDRDLRYLLGKILSNVWLLFSGISSTLKLHLHFVRRRAKAKLSLLIKKLIINCKHNIFWKIQLMKTKLNSNLEFYLHTKKLQKQESKR